MITEEEFSTILGDKEYEKKQRKLAKKQGRTTGQSNQVRKEEKKENISKKLAKRREAASEERFSWRKRIGGFTLVAFMFGAAIFQFCSTVFKAILGNGITHIDIQDTAKLKEVLFGGEPWLVHCVNNETLMHRLPDVFENSAWPLYRHKGISSAVMKCWDPTSSGRSIATRFKLRESPPLAFVIANNDHPHVVKFVGMQTIEQLEKKIMPALEITVPKIDSLKKFPALCTSHHTCVVIGHKNTAQRDTALSLFRPLLTSNRGVKTVTVDTEFWKMKLDKALIKRRPDRRGGGGGANVVCIARQESGSSGNATYSGTFLEDLTSNDAVLFLRDCRSREGLSQMLAAPKIQARPSKPKPRPSPTPAKEPPAPTPPKKKHTNVDHVGSRANLESDEPMFESVIDAEDEEEVATNEDETIEL